MNAKLSAVSTMLVLLSVTLLTGSIAAKGDKTGVGVNVQMKEQTTKKEPARIVSDETIKIPAALKKKWKPYGSYDQVRMNEDITPYVPTELPIGAALQGVAFQDGIIRSQYESGGSQFIFIQSQKEVPSELCANMADGEPFKTNRGTMGEINWVICTQNAAEESVKAFIDSLIPLPPSLLGTAAEREVIASGQLYEEPKEKFLVFTPEQFKVFAGKNDIEHSLSKQPNAGEIIIGVFSGGTGNSIAFDEVTFHDRRIYTTFRVKGPDPGASYPAVESYPFQFITVTTADRSSKINSVQFMTSDGEAIAHLPVDIAGK